MRASTRLRQEAVRILTFSPTVFTAEVFTATCCAVRAERSLSLWPPCAWMAPRACALKLAGYEPTPGFKEAERLLSGACVSQASYEPPRQPAVHFAHQSAKVGHNPYSLGWHGGNKLEFLC